MRRVAGAVAALACALALGGGTAVARGAADLIDITAVAVEGANAEQCNARVARLAEQSRALSLATSPPYDLTDGLRTFYDHVLRLDAAGELQSLAQLSTVYVAAHGPGGVPEHRTASPFVRVEVARPAGTPADAPSRIAIAWLWLHRLADARDPASGRTVQQPLLHRFDFVGEVATTYSTWGHAVAPCRVGRDGLWFGAVAVWTYLAP
jgi:hypothetical protein